LSRQSQRCEFETPDGIRLAGVLELPATTALGTILFSHCFTCSKDLKSIVKMSRFLAEMGWSVMRYDFRGLGSSLGSFADSSFSTNMSDLLAAADFLSQNQRAPEILMGYSFGGAASLACANRVPNLKGVVALSTPSNTIHLADLLEEMAPSLVSSGQGDVVIGGLKYKINRSMTEDFRSHDLQSLIKGLSVPMLALHSRTDETVPYEHALINCRTETNRESGPPRSLVTLPDWNHLLIEDDSCRRVAMIVDGWCRAIVYPKPSSR
jgi:uncharacterized protein